MEPIDAWKQLAALPELMAEARQAGDYHDLKVLERLRKKYPPALALAALECVEGRRRLTGKVDNPEIYLADRLGAEQATALPIARYKAGRMEGLQTNRIFDLCCGIGLDACGLAEKTAVTAIDRDPVRVWMTQANLQHHQTGDSRAMAGDVEAMDLADLSQAAIHIDPDRRPRGRHQRTQSWEDMQPGPQFLEELIRRARAVALKLSPAADFSVLPGGHLELIATDRGLSQAVLWTGGLEDRPRLARTVTRFSGNGEKQTWTAPFGQFIPAQDALECGEEYLLEMDALIERADLTGAFCQELQLQALHPALGLLVSAAPLVHPWVRTYHHLASMPWREKKVHRWLLDHDAGTVVVRTRARAADCDRLTQQFSGTGSASYTVFILRHGQKAMAYLTQPL